MEFVKILLLVVYVHQNVDGFFNPYRLQNMDTVTSGIYCSSSGCRNSSVPSEPATTTDDG